MCKPFLNNPSKLLSKLLFLILNEWDSMAFLGYPVSRFLFIYLFCLLNHTKEFQGKIAITVINYVRCFSHFVSSLLAIQLISYFSSIQASIICWLNKRRGNFRNTKSWNVWDLFLFKCVPYSAYLLLKEIIYRDLSKSISLFAILFY